MTVPALQPKKIGPKRVAPNKVAIVVHQEHSRPGRVGVLLEKRGYELHRLCPNLGCSRLSGIKNPRRFLAQQFREVRRVDRIVFGTLATRLVELALEF
mgnify:CR=1 FL=1